MAEFSDIFNRVQGYRERVNSARPPGMEGYGGRLDSVRNAYYQRLEQERLAAEQANAAKWFGAAARGGGGFGGGGGTGVAARPGAAPASMNEIQKYAALQASKKYGWKGPQWDALYDLVRRESGWRPGADNPTSSAWGLFQFIESTSRNYGIPHGRASWQQQVDAGLRYIYDRYKSPAQALKHWQARVPINGRDVGHWY